MEQVNIILNAREIKTEAGKTILETAHAAGVRIPTLCFLKECNANAVCRMCVVEVKGMKTLVPSCVVKVHDGMQIQTDSEKIREYRKRTLDLLCREHRMDCDRCARYRDCELHAMVREYGLDDRVYARVYQEPKFEPEPPFLIRDNSKCIRCRRCVSVCSKIQGIGVFGVFGRGVSETIHAAEGLSAAGCVACGQCIAACPTGALSDFDMTQRVWKALNQGKNVAAVIAPAAEEHIAEVLGNPAEKKDAGRLVSILRKIGFTRIYSAESEICKNRIQLLNEVKESVLEKKRLPIIDSSCPSVKKLIENKYPQLLSHLSAAENPMVQCLEQARFRTAEELKISPENILVVLIDSCTADKNLVDGSQNEIVLTVRETGNLIIRACVSRYTALDSWKHAVPESYDRMDDPEYVMDSEWKNGAEKFLDKSIRKEGLLEIQKILDNICNNEYEGKVFIARACPGGCSCGGGQPNICAEKRNFPEKRKS